MDTVAVRVIVDVSPSSIGDNGVNSGFVGKVDKASLPLTNKGIFC